MVTIQTQLQSLGLTSMESKIYAAALPYSSIGVQELMRLTQAKRPTIYHALETLIQKGLASKKGTGQRMVFCMTPLESLAKLLNQRIDALEEQKKTIDVLRAQIPMTRDLQGSSIHVAQFEGINGIKSVIEEMLYCKTRHWDMVTPVTNFFNEFDREYYDYFLRKQQERKISCRSLWEAAPSTPKHSDAELRRRNPRILPEYLRGQFSSVIILFDDKCAMVPPLASGTAILINSIELCRTMKVMFEGLWNISKPYKAR